MAYGTLLSDVVQSSTTNTPVQFKDGNGTQVGTLCRAWVNFNGTGTPAIRASFNVSSVTSSATGYYTLNFTNALSDANYSAVTTCYNNGAVTTDGQVIDSYTTTSCRVVYVVNGSLATPVFANVAVFR